MKTTMTARAAKMAEKKARLAKLDAINAACADEHARFNAAIRSGARVTIKVATYEHPLDVSHVGSEWRYFTPKANAGFGFHWYGSNDGVWADMLRQAGVERNALFAAYR